MNVLLLNPVTRDDIRSLRIGRCQGRQMVGFWPNVEYGYIATLLAAEQISSEILDANFLGLAYEAMVARVLKTRPEVVFILSITATIEDDVALGRTLVAALPGLRVVFWGTHATVRPQDYLFSRQTLVIRREPEVTALELCRALREHPDSFSDLPGVSWFDGHQVVNNPDRDFLDPDSLPMASHSAMGTGKHVAIDTNKPFALIKVSRGCPNSCQFCTAQTFHGFRWRKRSPESVVDEIEFVGKTTGITDFFLQSDLFSNSRDWSLELCNLILSRGLKITWFCNSRVDRVDTEVLTAMKKAGCRLVAFGIESGSDQVLKTIRKGAGAEAAVRALSACREVGIPSLTYWVFGLPGETPETIEETLKFISENRSTYAHFYAPTPLPGSRLYEDWDLQRQVDTGRVAWREFFQGVSTRFVTPEVSSLQVDTAISKAYLSYYTDPGRILRELASLKDLDNFLGKLKAFKVMMTNYVVKK